MKQIKIILTGVLCVILQITLLNLLTIRGIKPDIVILFIIVRALADGPAAAVGWGFSLGLLLDTAGGGLLGFGALTYSLAGFIAGQIGSGKIITRARFLTAVVVGAAVVYGMILYFHQPWQTVGWIKPLLSVTIPGIFYTWMLGLFWMLGPFAHFNLEIKRG